MANPEGPVTALDWAVVWEELNRLRAETLDAEPPTPEAVKLRHREVMDHFAAFVDEHDVEGGFFA